MSSSDDSSLSEEDEDYIPEDHLGSDDDDDVCESDIIDSNGKSKDEVSRIDDDKNNKIDELWTNFKNDVSDSKKSSKSVVDQTPSTEQKSKNGEEKKNEESKVEGTNDTVTITQVYDFAGEDVKVTKEVKRDSVEAINHFKQHDTTLPTRGNLVGRSAVSSALKKRSSGGISSVLGRLGKKPKLSTLEKSKIDWKQYKEEEGIEDELKTYNKGKEGYLEKVSFLERTEMRQFERERDMRLKQSSKR